MIYKKIINDPVYGFIDIPQGLIFNIIEHPLFQRLRYIKQVGLSHYVYPGALHTRFHHALGAMHLALKATEILRAKNISISTKEKESLACAMLLHDIGHGPFSHALEFKLVDLDHESISLLIMQLLNKEMNNELDLCIQMFKGEYHRPFFQQLIHSQLDLDRIDYLARDSYFTGVTEGRVAYDRLLHMMNVRDEQLVIEEKGIFSVEKFLFSRKLMYWQVYLHKTVLSAEQMLIKIIERIQDLLKSGENVEIDERLKVFLKNQYGLKDINQNPQLLLDYCSFDDIDISFAIKKLQNSSDTVLRMLCNSLINRDLFKLIFNLEDSGDFLASTRLKIAKTKNLSEEETKYLVFEGIESTREYNLKKEEILILLKNSSIEPISFLLDLKLKDKALVKSYICYPKNM